MTSSVTVQATSAAAARSALWSAVESGGLALLSFACLVIYSRMLGPAEFGVFSMALALVELLGVLVSMSFHDALVQREQVSQRHFDTAFTLTCVLALALTAGLVLAAPLLGRWLGDASVAPVLVGLSLCFPASALSATIVARRRRELQFRVLALRSLSGRLVGALAGIVLVYCGAGVWALVAQQVLMQAVGTAVLWVTAQDRPRLRAGWQECRELTSFGVFSVGTLFIGIAVKRLFVLVAGAGLGSHAAGLLNLSMRVVEVLWSILATAVSQVALPVLSRVQQDTMRLREVYESGSAYSCLVLYPCFVLLACTAPEIVELLFGEQWLPAVPYMQAMSLLVLVQALRLLAAPVLTARGRPRDNTVALATELAVVAAAGVVGIDTLVVAIGVWAMRECLGAPLTGWLLWRETGLGLRDQIISCRAPLVAALLMALSVVALRATLNEQFVPLARLLAMLLPAASVYVAAVLVLERRHAIRLFGLVTRALARH